LTQLIYMFKQLEHTNLIVVKSFLSIIYDVLSASTVRLDSNMDNQVSVENRDHITLFGLVLSNNHCIWWNQLCWMVILIVYCAVSEDMFSMIWQCVSWGTWMAAYSYWKGHITTCSICLKVGYSILCKCLLGSLGRCLLILKLLFWYINYWCNVSW